MSTTPTYPWLRHYDAGVPHTLRPYPERTLVDYLREAARMRPRAAALLFKGTRITNARLEAESNAFAAALAAGGVARGDRVILLMPNCPQFIIAELAAWKLGALVAPLNPLHTVPELRQAMQRTEPHTVVTLTRFYERVKEAQPGTSVRRVVATNIKEYLPPALRVLYTALREKKEGDRVVLQSGDARFRDLLRRFAGAQPAGDGVRPSDPAVLLMSGGTTGTPKAAEGSHAALVASGAQLRAWLVPVLRSPAEDRVMLPLPLFHVFGFAGVQSMAFMGGNALSLVPNPRDLDDLLRTIAQVRPSITAGVPALFAALLQHPRVRAGKADLSCLRACFSGASALPQETLERFQRATGGVLVEGYSLTEAMMACIANSCLGANEAGSVGVPLPDVEVAVVDGDAGEAELPAGTVGEVVMRAPQLMTGYWGDPEATAQTLRRRDAGPPWLFTGDLGFLDRDHVLHLVDRKKDLIKVSGQQVWPREIEDVISLHPAVAEVGVAGIPHDRKGEVAKAWVVLKAEAAALEAEIREHCRQYLAPYKVPASVEFRTELPRNLMGKVLRRVLRADHAASAGVGAEAAAASSQQPADALEGGDTPSEGERGRGQGPADALAHDEATSPGSEHGAGKLPAV